MDDTEVSFMDAAIFYKGYFTGLQMLEHLVSGSSIREITEALLGIALREETDRYIDAAIPEIDMGKAKT